LIPYFSQLKKIRLCRIAHKKPLKNKLEMKKTLYSNKKPLHLFLESRGFFSSYNLHRLWFKWMLCKYWVLISPTQKIVKDTHELD